MIYTISDGMVNVKAETIEESVKLLRIVALGTKDSEEVTVPVKRVRKQKKHVFKKECPICGRVFKGKLALAIHMAWHRKQEELGRKLTQIAIEQSQEVG